MADSNPEKATNVYGFKVRDLDGELVEMEKYKGKVLLIVNTAANCGLNKENIRQMKILHEKYKDQGLCVLGFPSNDFKQGLDCEADIKEFVKANKIEFDYFGKIHVNGDDTEPLYRYLKAANSSIFGSFIKWNFTKFLVNKEGVAVKRYAPTTSPASIEKDIEKLLQ